MSQNHIYYNATIDNKTDLRKLAKFDATRVVSILDKPTDYKMAVVRFSLPLTSLPLLVFKENYFSVSLKYQTQEISEYVKWIPTSNKYTDELFIYNIQSFLDMINKAYLDAFTILKNANLSIASIVPPFFSFETTTNLITLNVPDTYLATADNIEIFTNEKLYLKINTFQDFYYQFPYEGRLNYKFVINDLYDNKKTINGIDYFLSTQQYSTIGSISDIKSIEFYTNKIAVNKELIGDQKNITNHFLTDFELVENNELGGGGVLNFIPLGEIRYIDLLSNDEMKSLDIYIYWTTKDGRKFPYYLETTDIATIKILFLKRENIVLQEFIDKRLNELTIN